MAATKIAAAISEQVNNNYSPTAGSQCLFMHVDAFVYGAPDSLGLHHVASMAVGSLEQWHSVSHWKCPDTEFCSMDTA